MTLTAKVQHLLPHIHDQKHGSLVDIVRVVTMYFDRNFQKKKKKSSVVYGPLNSFSLQHRKQTAFESFKISSKPTKTNQN